MLSRPSNLQLLEDHPGELDPDGVHFNIMSSINFVQDLHDQAMQLSLKAPPDVKERFVDLYQSFPSIYFWSMVLLFSEF